MKIVLIISSIIFLYSCSSNTFKGTAKKEFQASATITKYSSIADMNDAYFEIKENNYFEFYMQLFDSVKNTSYPGKYSKSGDTIYLNFYNKKAEKFLGSKALINPNKKEIIFFDNYSDVKKKLLF